MPSHSLQRWYGETSAALDEIANAHAHVGGTERGRRFATQQINYAYATLLSSQFQGYCRDLHSECIDHVIAALPANLQPVLRAQLKWNRALDRGNPNSRNIEADFARFGVAFWDAVRAENALNERRRAYLDELNVWRNAIAHQDFDPARLGGPVVLHLGRVRQWRSSLNALADSFDKVMRAYLSALLGSAPW